MTICSFDELVYSYIRGPDLLDFSAEHSFAWNEGGVVLVGRKKRDTGVALV
ncbi:MAG: hypothetical protein OJF49_001414 [Ktedonobacterales bacterium]|jgi:hypothetical protein|nr:MAG: hypothetical protein OJF49_001414 [Ktedonobacterales bacterium]